MAVVDAAARPVPIETSWWVVGWRSLTAGIFAGGIAGIIAGGLGSRLAMRVTAIMATEAEQGALTEADQIVGDVTVGGTLGLIIFGGMLTGMLGGLMYAVLSRWFAGTGGGRGLVFGFYLLGALGWTIIEGDNFDFSALGSVTVNVLMYAAIFVLFGVLVAPLYSWLNAVLPAPLLTVGGALALPLYLLALMFLLAVLGFTLAMFGEDGREAPLYAIFPLFLIGGGLLTIVLARRRGIVFETLKDLGQDVVVRNVAWAVVLVPLAVGMALGAQSLVEMVGDAY